MESAFYVRRSVEVDAALNDWTLRGHVLERDRALECRFVILLNEEADTFKIVSLLEIENLEVQADRRFSCAVIKRTLILDQVFFDDFGLALPNQPPLEVPAFDFEFSKYFKTYSWPT